MLIDRERNRERARSAWAEIRTTAASAEQAVAIIEDRINQAASDALERTFQKTLQALPQHVQAMVKEKLRR